MSAPGAQRSGFYQGMALAFMAIGLTGFSTTFFLPLARGTFSAPPVIHIHGAMLFAWLGLFILQARLMAIRRPALHRQFGAAGAVLAAAIVVSGVAVGLFATRRDLASGGNDFVLGQFVNILIEMALFGALVAAAVVKRRDGESHKRLMMLATISVLAPAWLRLRHLFPAVNNPFIVFSLLADSLWLLVMARDYIVLRRVHPVYLWAGGAMFAVHMLELAALTSPPWLWLARTLLGLPQA